MTWKHHSLRMPPPAQPQPIPGESRARYAQRLQEHAKQFDQWAGRVTRPASREGPTMQAGITAWIKQHGAAFVALAAAVGAVVANTQAGSFVAETEHIITTAIAVGGFGGAVLHAFLNGLDGGK